MIKGHDKTEYRWVSGKCTETCSHCDFKTSRLLSNFPSLKKLIEKQQNIAKIPIMDTDSMDTSGMFLTE